MKNLIKSVLVLGSAVGMSVIATPAQAQAWQTECIVNSHFVAQRGYSTLCFDDQGTTTINDDLFYMFTDHREEISLATLRLHGEGGITMGLTELGQDETWVKAVHGSGRSSVTGSEYIFRRYGDDLQVLIDAVAEISAEDSAANLSFTGE